MTPHLCYLAGEKMRLEGMTASPESAIVGDLRWSNDGTQTLGVDDLPGVVSSLCSIRE